MTTRERIMSRRREGRQAFLAHSHKESLGTGSRQVIVGRWGFKAAVQSARNQRIWGQEG